MPGPTLRLSGVCFNAGRQRILNDVHLAFRPGELTAVLGPSGCGKSTLIKCLTTTYRPSRGSVEADGQDLWGMRDAYRLRLGYVPQDDVVHRQLTVNDAFFYSARLRLDAGLSDQLLRGKIDHLASRLGLAERRKLRVGRLSGGQRKRVNIGIELLADPQVLVLDEPASGLDPGTEEDLVGLLRGLAADGRTVVLTTHSMEQLGAYDRLVLMLTGNIVFAGAPRQLCEYFAVRYPGEVFKTLRAQSLEYWVSRYRSSPLSERAAR